MGSLFNPDFQDFIRALNAADVEYLLLGGYAVILYGYDRTTGDMDVWVRPTAANYARLAQAFRRFGMPVFDMTPERFLDPATADVFSFGIAPSSIDILTAPKGVEFEDCHRRRNWIDYEGLPLCLISEEDLLVAKAAAGRQRDLDDIEQLGRGED